MDFPSLSTYIDQEITIDGKLQQIQDSRKAKAAKAYSYFGKFVKDVIQNRYGADNRDGVPLRRSVLLLDIDAKLNTASKLLKEFNRGAEKKTREKSDQDQNDPNSWAWNKDKMRKITKHVIQHPTCKRAIADLLSLSETQLVKAWDEYDLRLILMILLLLIGIF